MSAYKKQSADAADLRKHGYIKEADAVQKVANKSKAKAIASQQKYDKKFTNAEKVNTAKTKMDAAKKNYKTKKDHYIRTWSNASDDAWDKAYKETYESGRKMGLSKRKSEKKAMKIASVSAGAAEGKVINKLRPGVVEAKNEYKLAKKEYKKERKKINENYDKKARNIDKYIYSEGTRRKVNKLMNNGMTIEEARKKTHKEAVRNTLGALALIGGGYLYAKKKL